MDGCCPRSNTKAKLMALWGMLQFSYINGVISLHIFISMVLNGPKEFTIYSSCSFLIGVKGFKIWWHIFQIFFSHIYQSFNFEVDLLSKIVVNGPDVNLFFEGVMEGLLSNKSTQVDSSHISLVQVDLKQIKYTIQTTFLDQIEMQV